MIRLTGTLELHDGSTLELEVFQGEFAQWELYALRHAIPLQPDRAPPVLMLRYLGYAAAHRATPRAEWPTFEDWDATVASVNLEGEGLENPGEAATGVFPPVRSAG